MAEEHAISGPAIFDVQIVATMSSNGVERIYTYHKSGFEPFDQIEVMDPS